MAYKKVDTEKGFRNIITCTDEDNIEEVRIIFKVKNKLFKKRQDQTYVYTKGSADIRIIIEDNRMWGKPIVED